MKGMQKKRIGKFLKENPQYYLNPNSYLRLQNGECVKPDGEKVPFAKASDKEERMRYIEVENPKKDSYGDYMREQIKKAKNMPLE